MKKKEVINSVNEVSELIDSTRESKAKIYTDKADRDPNILILYIKNADIDIKDDEIKKLEYALEEMKYMNQEQESGTNLSYDEMRKKSSQTTVPNNNNIQLSLPDTTKKWITYARLRNKDSVKIFPILLL